jgi:hypothetical protein
VKKANIDFPELDQSRRDENIFFTILRNTNNSSGNVKLFNISYLNYLYETQSEKLSFKGLNYYNYKSNNFRALQNVNYEELQFSSGQLSGIIKCYEDSKLEFVSKLNNQNEPEEISYYQNGQLVKTIYLANGNINYEYEFENGTNLTLKKLDNKIDEANNYL